MGLSQSTRERFVGIVEECSRPMHGRQDENNTGIVTDGSPASPRELSERLGVGVEHVRGVVLGEAVNMDRAGNAGDADRVRRAARIIFGE